MKKNTRIILIILCSLCSLFISLLFLIPLYFLIKAKPIDDVKADDKPTYRNITNDFNILDLDDNVAKNYYRSIIDELELNDDYQLSKKELLDEYMDGDKIYKYLPYDDYKIKLENYDVYVSIDDEYHKLGSITDKAQPYIDDAKKMYLTFYHGEYKIIKDDDVLKDKHDSYFKFNIVREIKKEVQ